MKNRSALMLIETAIIIFVFALASAILIKCFATSHSISEQTRDEGRATLLAHNAAEMLKYTKGDVDAVLKELTPEAKKDRLTIAITQLTSNSEYLGIAKIKITKSKKTLFEIETGWQEEYNG